MSQLAAQPFDPSQQGQLLGQGGALGSVARLSFTRSVRSPRGDGSASPRGGVPHSGSRLAMGRATPNASAELRLGGGITPVGRSPQGSPHGSPRDTISKELKEKQGVKEAQDFAAAVGAKLVQEDAEEVEVQHYELPVSEINPFGEMLFPDPFDEGVVRCPINDIHRYMGMFVLTSTGEICFWNPKMAQVTGIQEEEAWGNPIVCFLLDENDQLSMQSLMEKALEQTPESLACCGSAVPTGKFSFACIDGVNRCVVTLSLVKSFHPPGDFLLALCHERVPAEARMDCIVWTLSLLKHGWDLGVQFRSKAVLFCIELVLNAYDSAQNPVHIVPILTPSSHACLKRRVRKLLKKVGSSPARRCTLVSCRHITV
jgi:hypothetical protein